MFEFYRLGLILGLGIIISIGNQNLFVIKQGLVRQYSYLSALICSLCDTFLILGSITGVGAILLAFPIFKYALLIAGIIFLSIYGGSSIRRGFDIKNIHDNLSKLTNKEFNITSIKKIILFSCSFSLLNPQAILDTMIVIGGSANNYNGVSKYVFALGTITASFMWFFCLTILSRTLSRRLLTPRFWQALEISSGFIMIFCALYLIYTQIL